MTTVMTDLELDRAGRLIAAADRFRDHWIPITGVRASGFAVPRAVPVEDLDQVEYDASRVPVARAAVASLGTDHQVLDVRTAAYPSMLTRLDGRPALLFLRGQLPESPLRPVAIVGSRTASTTGTDAARRLAADLAASGSVIVSGLAAGIDTAAHQGALDSDGATVAVMGTGVDRIFPMRNQQLANQIAEQGGLITQFPPSAEPTKTSFPARNALIAGLSEISVLIEMSERSGTRIEANCALAQGKQVLLWKPILGNQPWAKDLAGDPQVRFVSTSDEVIELAGR